MPRDKTDETRLSLRRLPHVIQVIDVSHWLLLSQSACGCRPPPSYHLLSPVVISVTYMSPVLPRGFPCDECIRDFLPAHSTLGVDFELHGRHSRCSLDTNGLFFEAPSRSLVLLVYAKDNSGIIPQRSQLVNVCFEQHSMYCDATFLYHLIFGTLPHCLIAANSSTNILGSDFALQNPRKKLSCQYYSWMFVLVLSSVPSFSLTVRF